MSNYSKGHIVRCRTETLYLHISSFYLFSFPLMSVCGLLKYSNSDKAILSEVNSSIK